jgi:hypothetical protein
MGSTIATTSLSGDRLDEYDYTDYGVQLHAPYPCEAALRLRCGRVASQPLDGRWITGIAPHSVGGQPTANFRKLAILGQDHSDYVGPGKRYYIDGKAKPLQRPAARSGVHAKAGEDSGLGGRPPASTVINQGMESLHSKLRSE